VNKLKVSDIRVSGSTFGPKGDATLVIHAIFDKLGQDGSLPNVFRNAWYANRERYDALKNRGVALNCRTLTYEPKSSSSDDLSELKLLTLDELIDLFEVWESDVIAQVAEVRMELAFNERCEKHHLNPNTSGNNTKGPLVVRLRPDCSGLWACGGTWSNYLHPRPWWFNSEHRIQPPSVEHRVDSLNDMTDEVLDSIEKVLTKQFEEMMAFAEAEDIVKEKLKNSCYADHLQIMSNWVDKDKRFRSGFALRDIERRRYENGEPILYPVEFGSDPIAVAEALDIAAFVEENMGVSVVEWERKMAEWDEQSKRSEAKQREERAKEAKANREIKKALAEQWAKMGTDAKGRITLKTP
jgi:hypothetical protein